VFKKRSEALRLIGKGGTSKFKQLLSFFGPKCVLALPCGLGIFLSPRTTEFRRDLPFLSRVIVE
jgi:hypothetical protein